MAIILASMLSAFGQLFQTNPFSVRNGKVQVIFSGRSDSRYCLQSRMSLSTNSTFQATLMQVYKRTYQQISSDRKSVV